MRFAPLLLLTLLAACAGVPAPHAPTSDEAARFDWFEYQGGDPVHPTARPRARAEYLNPILSGFYPDPSITRVGDDYYLVTSTFAYFPGIPVFHSPDLVNWTQIGNAIDRPEQLDFDGLGLSRGVFAPAIEHRDGVFYILNTCVDCGGNFVITATDPAGPWSDPVWLPEIEGGIDPSLFFDDDGKAYILNNGPPPGPPLYDGHRAIWIQGFDPASKRMIGPRTVLVDGGVDPSTKPIWIEGPHIFRREGWYYLIAAEGGTAEGHSQVVLRSRSVGGPYAPWSGNPILTQRDLDRSRPHPITSAGHADFVQTQNGEWWATFLAVRPYRGDFYNTGRETFLLPVRWVDGWPVITGRGQTIPYVHRRPNLPAQPEPATPTTGPLRVRDELDGPKLGPQWLMIRTPRERWHDFTSSPGALSLRARPVSLGSPGQPSFVGRRQQHQHAMASTAMRYTPARAGDEAGLVAFQNEAHWYFLGVALENGRTVVRLKRRAGETDPAEGVVLASAPVAGDRAIVLTFKARGDRYEASYADGPGPARLLATDLDGTVLSTRTAGGFVGAVFGLYAYAPQQGDAQ